MDDTTAWFYSYAQTILEEMPATRPSEDEDFFWQV